MSKYDGKELLELKGAAREYDIPAITIASAIKRGALRTFEIDGVQKLLRYDLEQFVTRTVKRGAGNHIAGKFRK